MNNQSVFGNPLEAFGLLLHGDVPVFPKLFYFFSAFAYTVMPVDLMPEVIMGPLGCVDDVTTGAVLLSLFSGTAQRVLYRKAQMHPADRYALERAGSIQLAVFFGVWGFIWLTNGNFLAGLLVSVGGGILAARFAEDYFRNSYLKRQVHISVLQQQQHQLPPYPQTNNAQLPPESQPQPPYRNPSEPPQYMK